MYGARRANGRITLLVPIRLNRARLSGNCIATSHVLDHARTSSKQVRLATVDEMIRPATPDDVDAVAHVWHDAWFDGHAGNVPDELLAHRNPEAFIRRTRD